MDYYAPDYYSVQAVGTNYNQVVKYCTAIFRKAAAYLYKLEKNS
jgi:hypothetical protein